VGVPVHVVAARLGHAKPSVTFDRYAHHLRDRDARVDAALAAALAAPTGRSERGA